MPRARVLSIGMVVIAALTACSAPEVIPPERVTISMRVRYSAFRPDTVSVPEGATVRFVIDNRDPIDHEFIVGPPEVHRRHENGTEQSHGAVPGEVTIPAGSTATTTYTFTGPGRVLFACHLPGHFDYGMKGWVEVTPASDP